MRSAPRPPRREAAPRSRVGAGPPGPEAGELAAGSARFRPQSEAPGRERRGGARVPGPRLLPLPGADVPSRGPRVGREGKVLPPSPRLESLCALFPRGEFKFCFLIPTLLSGVGGLTLLINPCAAPERGGPGNPEGGRPHLKWEVDARVTCEERMEEALGVEGMGSLTCCPRTCGLTL